MLRFALTEKDRNKVVSALAQVEMKSAIYRLRNANRLTSAEAASAILALTGELSRSLEQAISASVLQEASTLIERHELRALDAVQLACALVARDLLSAPEMRFVASDVKLLAAAHSEGFDTWNPEFAV